MVASLISANFFDNEDSIVLTSSQKKQVGDTSGQFKGPMGNVNSLIRKIKPTNFEFSNKKGNSAYEADKKPLRSILKVKKQSNR